MLFGIGLKLASTIAFILMSTQVKFLSNGYPVGQLLFCRAFFAMIPLLIWLDTNANHIRLECLESNRDIFIRRHLPFQVGFDPAL